MMGMTSDFPVGEEPKRVQFYVDHLGGTRAVVDLGSGTVVERSDYYPYGVRIGQPTSSDSVYPQLTSNRWRYAGKEEQEDVSGLPFLDFGARQYDPALGSWLSQDPLAKDYPSLSPYAYCAGDPVNLVDPEGMYFTPGSEEYLSRFTEDLDRLIEKTNRRIRSLEESLSSTDLSERKRARLEGRLSKAQSMLNELKAAGDELEELRESTQQYDITVGSLEQYNTSTMTVQAITGYDLSNNQVQIVLGGIYGTVSLAHELKHAYQFEKGQIGFDLNGESGKLCDGKMVDYYDEEAAFYRGSVFGGPRKPGSVYDSLTKKHIGISPSWSSERIKRFVESNPQTLIRYNGITYNK